MCVVLSNATDVPLAGALGPPTDGRALSLHRPRSGGSLGEWRPHPPLENIYPRRTAVADDVLDRFRTLLVGHRGNAQFKPVELAKTGGDHRDLHDVFITRQIGRGTPQLDPERAKTQYPGVLLSIRRLAVATLLPVAFWAAATRADEAGHILIRTGTMLGQGIPAEDREKLSVAVSDDGLNWRRLFRKATLTNFSRDASVIRHGREYVTVYTDAFNSTTGTFGLAKSTNLVEWTATNVALTGPAMSNTPNNTWAPEWFVDGGRYYVMVRSSQRNTGFTNFPNYAPPGIGYLECLDPGTWTNWTEFTPIADLEPAYENDPFLLKVGETCHLFTDHFNYPGGPAILHRQSTNGPFTGYGPPVNIATNFANAPAYIASGLNRSSPWEGQFVLPLGGTRYRLYFQAVWHDASFCIDSPDGMQTWDNSTMQWLSYDGLPAYGHGSVLRISYDNFLVPAITAAKLPDNSVPDVQAALGLYIAALSRDTRSAGQSDVVSNPGSYGLYTAGQFSENRAAGRADVLADPTSYGLFTEDAIMDLNLGGVVVRKAGDGVSVRLQFQTTADLSTSFTNHSTPIDIPVDLPGDKHFLRVRALGPQ